MSSYINDTFENPHLWRTVHFERIQMSVATFEYIVRHGIWIRHLRLGRTLHSIFTNTHVNVSTVLSNGLSKCTNLISLNLQGICQLVDCEFLLSMKSLTELDLSGCTEISPKSLVQNLPLCTHLSHLSIEGLRLLTEPDVHNILLSLSHLYYVNVDKTADLTPRTVKSIVGNLSHFRFLQCSPDISAIHVNEY
jgi:hypothetical protein